MRRSLLLPLLVLCLLTACRDSTGPRTFSIAGTWETVDLPGARIQFTGVEALREVNGAGHLITPDSAIAFRLGGAIVEQRVSLLFDFDVRDDLNFVGRFEEGETSPQLVGSLYGGGYRAAPVIFRQIIEEED